MSLETDCRPEAGETLVPEDIEATIVFDAYQEQVHAGRAPDWSRLLTEHPALADRLKTLNAAHQRLASVVGDLVPTFHDFRIVREIGRGGMGIVYEAEQLSRRRPVAIKVLTAAAAMDPQHLKRFLQVEVPAAKLLNHPHIVPIVDFGCEQGLYFYAMRLIEGQSLDRLNPKAREFPDDASGPAATTAEPGTARSNGKASGPISSPAGQELFRQVARWGIQAAEGLEFAHQQGVVHRDIKPSNLLLDGQSNVWISDFGLARIQGDVPLSMSGDLVGTPRYMSPEQVQARRVSVDHRTDIYSLGASLYELLTARPAIHGDSPQDVMRRVVEEAPRSPRSLNPAIPRDLETIVLKAMSKDRDDRYRSAQELADDLHLFLDHKPIAARRPSLLDRSFRWARGHRRTVASVAALLLATIIGLSVSVYKIARAERSAVAAGAQALAAGAQARERERESKFETLIQEILRIRLTEHFRGWSEQTWDLVSKAEALNPPDRGALQAEAAATLRGLDARTVKYFEAQATTLAFDPQGKRLWMAGSGQRLRSWDGTEEQVEIDGPVMDGPIAFHADGTPLHLGVTQDAATGLSSLQLWDAGTHEARTLDLPAGARVGALALAPGAIYAGAAVQPGEGDRSIQLWELPSGKPFLKIDYPATGLVFSPDAKLLAAWNEAGQVRLWSLPDAAPVATLQAGTTAIHCAAFSRPPGRGSSTFTATSWLLAIGDAGGTVTLWNLESGGPIARCLGSKYDVYSVAFSPDGTTLLSAGRELPRLWDVATGRLLLNLNFRNRMTAVAFAPEGTRLAVASELSFGTPGGVDVYELENGHGIRTFRGLRTHVPKTIYSRDGKLVAALAQDWQVAIWEVDSGRLRLLLDVPNGEVADNSGLAFSPDGRQFAFSADREAKLWDIETGKVLGDWQLPPGLQDTLAFNGPESLMLLRREWSDAKADAAVVMDPAHPSAPRVMRLRNLLGEQPTEPIRVISDFDLFVRHTAASPDGKFFVVEGVASRDGGTRSINAYDAATGERRWTFPSRRNPESQAQFCFDPSGTFLAVAPDPEARAVLLKATDASVVGNLGAIPASLGPDAQYWLGIEGIAARSKDAIYSVHGRNRRLPLLQIDVEDTPSSVLISFSPVGHELAWGNANGSVSVCDLDKVGLRLAEVGLGW